jgi:hypothetical protein
MTRSDIVAVLQRDNPRAKIAVVSLYADAFQTYQEATANIAQYGAIVQHPRTGQPMPNPYLPLQSAARVVLQKLAIPKTDSLWRALSRELARVSALPSASESTSTPT